MAERFFFWLGRINAVLLLVALVNFLVMMGLSWWATHTYSEEPWLLDYEASMSNSGIVGDEVEIADGKVVAYRLSSADGWPDGELDTNITLVNVQTGARRVILADEDARSVRSWDVIHARNDEDGEAIGYLVRAATDAQWERKRMDVIVGRFSDLRQVPALTDVEAVDSPQLRGDRNLALIVWTGATSAELKVFDFNRMAVAERQSIPLPELGDSLSLDHEGNRSASVTADTAAADAAEAMEDAVSAMEKDL